MHCYPRFAPPSQRAIVDLVRENPFAVVTSAEDGRAPVASHLPMILPADLDPDVSLADTVIVGHMGRKNPHWHQFREPREVLLIFSSPHGYVSPQIYDFSPAAPTLDYAAVHLTGVVELIEDRAGTLQVLEATVAALESMRPTAWDPSDSREYFDRILTGVSAFRVRITDQQAMFKLSQDMSDPVRGEVRADFAQGPHRYPQLVHLLDVMEEYGR